MLLEQGAELPGIKASRGGEWTEQERPWAQRMHPSLELKMDSLPAANSMAEERHPEDLNPIQNTLPLPLNYFF